MLCHFVSTHFVLLLVSLVTGSVLSLSVHTDVH